MKKFMKSLMLVTAVAMGFTACTNDLLDEANTNTGNTFTLTISAEKPALEGTRTEFSNGSVIWSGVEKIRATYYHSSDVWSKYYASDQDPQIATDGSTATFTINTAFPAQSAEGEYTFYAGYPQNAIGSSTTAPTDGVLAVTVPTEQTMPKMGTFDASADIMVGKSLESYTEVTQTIPIYWTRLVSHVCVTLKNLAAEEGEIIKTVTFTAPEGVMLTGAGKVNFTEQSMTALDDNTVTVSLPTNTAANVTELPVWFCSAPATIASGKDFTITVETPRGTYTRTITARSEGIQFAQNKYSTLSVNMASAEFTPAAVSANVFQMITSESELTTGEYVLAAKYNNTYYPMSTTFGSKINATSSITVTNDQIVEKDAEGYVLTLTTSANGVSIYNGSQYLAYSSSTDFKTTTTASNWTVKYTDNQFQFLQTRYILWYYNNGTSRFGAYATTNWNATGYSGLYLFKKVTNDPTAPTMSLDKNEISIEQAGGSATITATTTNYTGAITATSDNAHFTTSVDGNVITVTAPANEETTVKTATITITAGTISKEVAVTQAANLGLIGKGTTESPYTVNDAIKLMSTTASSEVYTKGIISSITEISTQYGNATYNISDDGTTTAEQVTVFRGKYLNNESFSSADQIKVGDEVVIYGKLQLYSGTPEITSGNYIYSLTSTSTEEPVQLATPVVDAVAKGNTISVIWADIENATSYTVTYGTTTIENAISPCTISDLAYNTTYDFSVVAVGDGTNYTNSEAGKATATTEADPNAGSGDGEGEGEGEGEENPVTVTLDLTAQGYSDTQNLDNTTLTIDNVSISFTKGDNNSTLYYTNGTSVRIYTGGTMTVSAPTGKKITEIVITGLKNNTTTTFTANVGTFSISNWNTSNYKEATWTGNSESVVFTVGTTKHVRIQKVVVTFE